MKILDVEKIEIRFEKQPNLETFNWCIYCKTEKGNNSKINFMIKSKKIPYVLFQENKGNIIINSKKIKNEILKNE